MSAEKKRSVVIEVAVVSGADGHRVVTTAELHRSPAFADFDFAMLQAAEIKKAVHDVLARHHGVRVREEGEPEA